MPGAQARVGLRTAAYYYSSRLSSAPCAATFVYRHFRTYAFNGATPLPPQLVTPSLVCIQTNTDAQTLTFFIFW